MRRSVLSVFLLLLFVMTNAQSRAPFGVVPKGCFLLEVSGDLGFSDFQSQDFSKVSGQTTGMGILASYSFANDFRLSAGINKSSFKNSNIDTNGEYANLEASFIEIPLRANYSFDIMRSHNIQFALGFGGFAGKNISNSFKTKTIDREDVDKKWYFGLESSIGTEFAINKDFIFGIYFVDKYIPNFAKTEKISLKDNSQIKIALLINLF